MGEQFDIKLFKDKAVETVIWCNLRLLLAKESKMLPDALRSVVPKPSEELLFSTPPQLNKFIEEVFRERTRMLKISIEVADLQKGMSDYNKGRLVAFFPYLNMNDGTAHISSERYFDYSGFPPWDTWIYHIKEKDETNLDSTHIIAWVPPVFIEAANDGIKFNPDDSLIWLTNPKLKLYPFDLSYIDILDEAKLLV